MQIHLAIWPSPEEGSLPAEAHGSLLHCCWTVNELRAAQAELALGKLEKRRLQYDLLIIDELGHIPFSKEG